MAHKVTFLSDEALVESALRHVLCDIRADIIDIVNAVNSNEAIPPQAGKRFVFYVWAIHEHVIVNCTALLELGGSDIFQIDLQETSEPFAKFDKLTVCGFQISYVFGKSQRDKFI